MNAAAAINTIPQDGRTRRRILAAAQKRFAVRGYRHTAIADIAREAGLAAGTLYRYFADKEHLFRAVLEALHEGWLARAREVLAQPGTPVERLARLGHASIAFNRENPLINSVFARDNEMIFAPLLDELHTRFTRANVALIADVLRAGVEDGSFHTSDPERAAYVLFMTGEVLSRNQHLYLYEDVLPVFQDVVMRGLLPR
ncbi:MAG TPA: TetR/AcrR family transcriptional regulator [Candidatus Binatia bacterium]|nr:TetR/AcrR family transcriptional regulator [Candidatus Binatia bacterium]